MKRSCLAFLFVSLFVLAVSPVSGVILLSENFESLILGPYVSPTESGGDGTDWTDVAPAGWVRDQGTTPVGSPVEFYGWTFHDRQSWINTEADQDRSFWTAGVGTVMVADPDAYDDGTNVDTGLYNVNILTPVISLAGIQANTVTIGFDSSFKAEPTEIALLDVTFDGTNFTNLLTFDGNTLPLDGVFNDPVLLSVNNPSSGTMRFRFSMNNASNDWWWAVDNISVSGTVPEPASGILLLIPLASLAQRRWRAV